MYPLIILDTPEADDPLYQQFLAIRLRFRQLVVLFMETWNDEPNQVKCVDTLLKIMQSKNPESLCPLDVKIIEGVKKGRGKIKIGSADVVFHFMIQQKNSCTKVYEQITAPTYIKHANVKFFRAFKEVKNSPPPPQISHQ